MQAKFLALSSLLQGNFSGGFGIAHPLGSSARGNHVALPLQLQQIDRSREKLAGFASANLTVGSRKVGRMESIFEL